MAQTDLYCWGDFCVCLKSQLDAGSSVLDLEDISKFVGAKPNSYPVELRISDGVNVEYVTFTGLDGGVPLFERSGTGTFPAGSSLCFSWTPSNIRRIVSCCEVDDEAVYAICVALSPYDNKGFDITGCKLQDVLEQIICALAEVRDSVLSTADVKAIAQTCIDAALASYYDKTEIDVQVNNIQVQIDQLNTLLSTKCDEIAALNTALNAKCVQIADLQVQIDECCNGGPPVADGTPPENQTITDGDTITPMDFSGCFSEPDGDTLTYALTPLIDGLLIDANTGIVTGSPTGLVGPWPNVITIIVTASDENGSAMCNATLTVNEAVAVAAPDVTCPENQVLTVDEAMTPVSPSNAGGAVPTGGWSISPALPAGMTFNDNTGQVSGTPTATSAAVTYTITATNAADSDTCTFDITVNDDVATPPLQGQVFDCIRDYALSSDFPTADAGVLFNLVGGVLSMSHTAPPNDETFLGGTQVGATGSDTTMTIANVSQFKVDGVGAQLLFAGIVNGVYQNTANGVNTWVKNLDSSPVVAAGNVVHNITITVDHIGGGQTVIPVKLDTRYRAPAGGGGGNMQN